MHEKKPIRQESKNHYTDPYLASSLALRGEKVELSTSVDNYQEFSSLLGELTNIVCSAEFATFRQKLSQKLSLVKGEYFVFDLEDTLVNTAPCFLVSLNTFSPVVIKYTFLDNIPISDARVSAAAAAIDVTKRNITISFPSNLNSPKFK